jgi:hypothetical protein
LEDWSNNACLGYVILAAKRMKLNEKETKLFVQSVKAQFDSVSVDKAADVYCQSSY